MENFIFSDQSIQTWNYLGSTQNLCNWWIWLYGPQIDVLSWPLGSNVYCRTPAGRYYCALKTPTPHLLPRPATEERQDFCSSELNGLFPFHGGKNLPLNSSLSLRPYAIYTVFANCKLGPSITRLRRSDPERSGSLAWKMATQRLPRFRWVSSKM